MIMDDKHRVTINIESSTCKVLGLARPAFPCFLMLQRGKLKLNKVNQTAQTISACTSGHARDTDA